MLLFSILTNQLHNSRSAFQTKLMLPKIYDGVVLKQQDKSLLFDADKNELYFSSITLGSLRSH